MNSGHAGIVLEIPDKIQRKLFAEQNFAAIPLIVLPSANSALALIGPFGLLLLISLRLAG
jgi:hypothetical protein